MKSTPESGSYNRIFTSNFLMVCLVNVAVVSSFYFLMTTVPLYIETIGGDESQVGLVVGVMAAGALVTRPLAGFLSDAWGRKFVIIIGASILLASTALYLLATSVPWLLLVRVLHGIGFAAFTTGIFTLAADISPIAKRGETIGYFGATINLAMVVGPALGIVLMESYGFQRLFYSSAGVALVGLLLSLRLSEPRMERSVKPKGRHALFERTALFPSMVMALVAVTYASIVTFIPIYTSRQNLGNPGLFFTVMGVVTLVARGPLGGLSDRYGRGVIVIPGIMLCAAGLILLAYTSSLPVLLTVSFLYGIGFAGVQPAIMALIVDSAPQESRGVAMGTFAASMDVGIGVGSLLWGFISREWGFGTMYVAAGGMALLALALFSVGYRSLGIKKRRGRYEAK
ncbi:MFS transporter [Chloroflexota bacterium]